MRKKSPIWQLAAAAALGLHDVLRLADTWAGMQGEEPMKFWVTVLDGCGRPGLPFYLGDVIGLNDPSGVFLDCSRRPRNREDSR